jgi:hypothetical protein
MAGQVQEHHGKSKDDQGAAMPPVSRIVGIQERHGTEQEADRAGYELKIEAPLIQGRKDKPEKLKTCEHKPANEKSLVLGRGKRRGLQSSGCICAEWGKLHLSSAGRAEAAVVVEGLPAVFAVHSLNLRGYEKKEIIDNTPSRKRPTMP